MNIKPNDYSSPTGTNCNNEERSNNSILSVLASYGSYKLVKKGRKELNKLFLKSHDDLNYKMQNLNMFNPEVCTNIFEASGLKEKGCIINNLAENNTDCIEQRIGGLNKLYSKIAKDRYIKRLDNATKKGDLKKVYKYKKIIEETDGLISEMNLAEKLSWKLLGTNYSNANIGSLRRIVYNELIEAGVENPSKKAIDRVTQNVVNNIRNLSAFKVGENAGYSPMYKEVSINLNKAASALPHELGHAKTHLTTKLGKYLPYISSSATKLAPLALLAAILCKPKDKRDESTTFIGKTIDFVKDNAVVLSGVAFIPQLVDESLASINGYKMAQKVVSMDVLNSLAKCNGKAFLTYLVAAVGTVLATFAADKVRNATC